MNQRNSRQLGHISILQQTPFLSSFQHGRVWKILYIMSATPLSFSFHRMQNIRSIHQRSLKNEKLFPPRLYKVKLPSDSLSEDQYISLAKTKSIYIFNICHNASCTITELATFTTRLAISQFAIYRSEVKTTAIVLFIIYFNQGN